MTVAVDVRELVHRPGASKRRTIRERVAGLRTELCRVGEDAEIEADLVLEGTVEGVIAAGAVSGVIVETCARCLKDFDVPFRAEVREVFSPEFGSGGEAEGGYPLPEDGFIDVEPMIRDAVVPQMPFSPLCRPDCQGLCPRCGGDRNMGECACEPEAADDRWAPLSNIVFPPEIRERTN